MLIRTTLFAVAAACVSPVTPALADTPDSAARCEETSLRIYFSHDSAELDAATTDMLRAARANIRYHLAYIGWLAQKRDWLAGDRLSYADLAAAAHLSVADYLGDVPWTEDESAKNWYARVKSRPSFRPILADVSAGLPPSTTYADLDF